ncbi:unnamed protein product [Calicophoron daubneyi]|uniref:Secreted protein n=1 Tax=Calicophoron daubneyi TaxID=300641 RepID=A0AAV2TKM8_CALDB
MVLWFLPITTQISFLLFLFATNLEFLVYSTVSLGNIFKNESGQHGDFFILPLRSRLSRHLCVVSGRRRPAVFNGSAVFNARLFCSCCLRPDEESRYLTP